MNKYTKIKKVLKLARMASLKHIRFLSITLKVMVFFMIASFKSTSQRDGVWQTNPGVIYADELCWSARDLNVYFKGDPVRVKHGDNDFTVEGKASYLGKVHYLIFDDREVQPDTCITLVETRCQVMTLTKEEAIQKYGSKGKNGAVEITPIALN